MGRVVLEKNPEADSVDLKFLRLRIVPTGANVTIANSMRAGNRADVRRFDLPEAVAKEGEFALVTGIPVVDQGTKGYCVVASVQRLFEYYGIPCHQHQFARGDASP